MSLRSEIMQGVKDLGVRSVRIDRDARLNGEDVVWIDVRMVGKKDSEAHTFTFARRNNMSAEQMVSVIRSYLPVPEVGMTQDELIAAWVDGRATLEEVCEALDVSAEQARQIRQEWEEATSAE